MKIFRTICLLFVFLPAFGGFSHGETITAKGNAAIFGGNLASARTQALLNAQRNAVEQGLGLMLDSQTVSRNMALIRDSVLTASKGFVTSYKILSEGPTSDRSTFSVEIRAEVSRDLLTKRLTALRILHKKMGNRRVMVLYRTTNPHALKREHGASTSALKKIRQILNQAGFRVFNEKAVEKIYQGIETAARVDRAVEDVIAMALNQRADVVVQVENVAGKRANKGAAFSSAFSTIRLSAYDVVTGRQIADSESRGKKLIASRAGAWDWENALSDAARNAAEQGGQELITKITNYYERIGDQGQVFQLVFRNFNDDEKDKIIDFLEGTPGFRQLSELKNTINYLELELFSREKASRLRRLIRTGLKSKGLTLQILDSTRTRIIFGNPARS